VTAEGLGAGADGEIGSEGERALSVRSRGGVIDGNEDSGGVCGDRCGGDVRDVEGGIGGGFEPEEACSGEGFGMGQF
jgi:hypothetical protein